MDRDFEREEKVGKCALSAFGCEGSLHLHIAY